MSLLARYLSRRRRRPTSSKSPRRLWWSCLCTLRCSVRSAIRLESIATCASGDPVSPSLVPYSARIEFLVAVSSATGLLRCFRVRPRSDSRGQVDTHRYATGIPATVSPWAFRSRIRSDPEAPTRVLHIDGHLGRERLDVGERHHRT